MKFFIGIFFLFFSYYAVSAQKYVHIMECDSVTVDFRELNTLSTDNPHDSTIAIPSSKAIRYETSTLSKGFKKSLVNKYSIGIFNTIDTIQLIRELLELEGDVRFMCIPIIGRSSISSTLRSSKQELTIQVYALYIIWGLFYDYQFTAKYPILTEKVNDNIIEEMIKGEIVEKAFNAYKKWFVEADGDLDKLRKTNPLKDSGIRWLF